ncbi:MAG: 30S ribosomal protein S5 [Candidatus Nanoarchaeia archaeon]|jgi:small subunit ribosomal protein S5
MNNNRKDKRNNDRRPRERPVVEWIPKTRIGHQIKDGEIKDINELLDNGIKIKEEGIVDTLLPELETELILIGSGKGKFGRGQRRAFRQTQRKTEDGSKMTFSSMAIVGNKKGFVGVGSGRSGETVPAREKAFKNAKKNVIRIKLGCGSWECGCGGEHSIPFAVEGKCGSTRIKLLPAPKGVGLCIHSECQKVLQLAGIKDVWSRTKGSTSTTFNLITALMDALNKLTTVKVNNK